MPRRTDGMRREKVPACDLRVGDVIDLGGWQPPANVYWSWPDKRDAAKQDVRWCWPDDSTVVNPKYRGKYDGEIWPGNRLITRLIPASTDQAQRHVQVGSINYTIRG
jgi:hypothetical protein